MEFKEGNMWKCCFDPEKESYTVVLDADYEKLCPWSDAMISGGVWDEDFTEAVVENLASEVNWR